MTFTLLIKYGMCNLAERFALNGTCWLQLHGKGQQPLESTDTHLSIALSPSVVTLIKELDKRLEQALFKGFLEGGHLDDNFCLEITHCITRHLIEEACM